MNGFRIFVNFLFCVVAIRGCGISTHTEIIQRASEFYNNSAFGPGEVRRIIRDQQGAFQAGAPFPDAFYNSLCKQGSLHYLAEDTHWAPFQKSAWNYFRKTYPDPVGNDRAEKLFAFLLGLTSHQVSDVLWHNLEGLKDGLLEMLAETTFDGSFNDAHDLADFGGDVLGVTEWNTDYANKWFVPSEDLYNIIVEHYGDDQGVTLLLIEECTAMLLAGRIAEQEGASLLYPTYASKSTIFLDEYQEYFMGGVDDMATWTRLVWDVSLEMAVNGTDHCFIPKNPMDISCDESSEPKISSGEMKIDRKRKENFFSSLEEKHQVSLQKLAEEKVSMKRLKNGGISLEAKKIESKGSRKSNNPRPKNVEPYGGFYLASPYAKLGWSLSQGDVNGDTVVDVLIGAPGYAGVGCVFIVYGTPNVLLQQGFHDLEAVADDRLCGSASYPYSRFGSAVLVQDFNGDGVNDVIVGAPTSGLEDITYDGLVHIFLGHERNLKFSQEADVIVRPPKDFSTSSSTFGWTLTSVRDGRFIVSGRHRTDDAGRQTGSIFVVDFSSGVSEIDLGNSAFDWSGSSVLRLSTGNHVVVGSPNWQLCAADRCLKGVGRVDIVDLSIKTNVASVFGETEFEHFGSSLFETQLSVDARLKRVLVVSSPTFSHSAGLIDNHKHAGSTLIFDLEVLLGGGSQERAFLLRFDSDKAHGRFGRSMHESKNLFFVGAPRYSGFFETSESGAVFGFSRSHSWSSGSATDDCSLGSILPCPDQISELILDSPDQKSLFGQTLMTINETDRELLLVAAPYSSQYSRLSGVVYIYNEI